jgi:glycosyltransferase involved in cell wall biosynthesis
LELEARNTQHLTPNTQNGSMEPEIAAVAATRSIRPLFTVGGLYSTANGVAWIMRDLAAALGRIGAPVTVCAADCVGRESIGHIFEPPTRWVTAPGRWLGGLSWSPKLKPILEREIAGADVVHNHSVWMLPTSYACRIAEKLDKPVVFTAHGTLEPWALSHSGRKKRLVGWAFQDRDLHRATCIHVNSRAEVEGIRTYGLKQPIAIIPNGVDAMLLGPLPGREKFERAFPQVAGKRIVLFMGRLHKKKGLELLLRAWPRLVPQFNDWVLVVAGPDNGFETTARQIIRELDLASSVILTGNLQGQSKREALGAADVFVLPSFSEGFSMAVLEAMAARLPVLITPGCNFPEAVEVKAAVCVLPTITAIEEGLCNLLGLSSQARASIGKRGHQLVASKYSWNHAARQTYELYRWLIESGPRPSFVVDDV